MRASRSPELHRRLAALLAWFALVLGGTALVHHTEAEQRLALDHLFASRASTSADFLASYVDDIVAQNVVLAEAYLQGPITSQTFARQMKASGIGSGVVLDGSGIALAVYPDNPAVIGTRMSDYFPHLARALSGTPSISDVVQAGHPPRQIVGFATPFDTPSGRRVFSPSYQAGLTPMQAYLRNEGEEVESEAIYLLDSNGVVVSSGGDAAAATGRLSDVNPDLAPVAEAAGVRNAEVSGIPVQVVVTPVARTPWRVVVSTPDSTRYASVSAADLWAPRLGLITLALALLVVMVLLERMNVQRSRIVEQQRALAEASERARDEAVAASNAKSAFLATMSHEIRTPMNAVIGMTDLLLGTRLDAQQQGFAETVRAGGQNLMLIIDDVLDFSAIEAGELQLQHQPFHPDTTVEDCLDLVAAAADAKSLGLYCEINEGCPAVVVGDRTRVRQVVSNLLANAVKFTAVGEVVVSLSTTTLEQDRVRLAVSVSDTGIGIPPDRLDRLFRSFSQVDDSTTRQYGGSGLGLAISRGLANAMGGELTVSSEVGRGSTFRFEVDLPAGSSADPAAPPRPLGLRDRRVLVVDPGPTSRRVLAGQLAHWGAVCTGVATVDAAETLLRGGTKFDATLVQAEIAVNGGSALGVRLRQAAERELPLVLLTSLRSEVGVQGLRKATTLTRPVKRQNLAAALGSVLVLRGAPVPTPPAKDATAPTRPAGPLRVLLAEDNPVNQLVAQLMLAKLGHVVDTVGNGAEAVAAAHATPYDLILMDIQMPVLDGLQATRRIRAELPSDAQPPILALTASASVHDQDVCLAAGMDGHLPKPIREAELRQCVEEVAALRPAAAATSGAGRSDAGSPMGSSPVDNRFSMPPRP